MYEKTTTDEWGKVCSMKGKSIITNSVKIVLCIFLLMVLVQGVRAAAPVAAFSGTPLSGTAPLPVQFTDASTGSPTGWAWFFGDETYTQAWTQQTASAGWTARSGHTSVAMPDGSIVLMGGYGGGIAYWSGGKAFLDKKNDVWRSTDNGATWTQMTANAGWVVREGHTSVAMPDGSIVLMGGSDSGNWGKNDVWRSTDNGATWTQMTANAGWTPRVRHSSVVMPDGSIVLMGGYDNSNIFRNDVWRSTDNGATWTQMTASSGWSGRYGPSSVAMPDGSIILIGGYAHGYANDLWRSTDNGATWAYMTQNAGWSVRYAHSSVVMPDGSIVLMGGSNIGGGMNDVWRSTDNGATWIQASTSAGWSVRSGQGSVAMPDGSIVLMGGSGNGYMNDTWQLMPVGSSAQNPSHSYTTGAIFNVSLQVYNAGGYTSTRKTGYVTVTAPPVANFVGTPNSGAAPLTVAFTDTSINTPTSWNWNFGDGSSSTEKNPAHTYISTGTYTVSLTTINSLGSNIFTRTNYINVAVIPVTNFAGTPTSGTVPLTVAFTDSSTNTPTSWNWNFGDWSSSTLQNPSHTYTGTGTYTVSLTATNLAGSNAKTITNYITVTTASPIADFNGTPTSGTAPLTVQFTDNSTGSNFTAWNWSFGDSTWFNTSTSSLRNPSHIYTTAGTYTANLIVFANASVSNTTSRTNYITVRSGPTPTTVPTTIPTSVPTTTITTVPTTVPTTTSTPTPTPTPSASPTLSFQPGTSTVSVGYTTTYTIMQDTATKGLSGYNITIALSNPSVGKIVGVTYPSWSSMTINSAMPAGSAWFQAVDLNGASGTTNIVLCTVTVRGDTVGTTTLAITSNKIEDRAGGQYTPTLTSAQFAVITSPVNPFPKPGGGYFPSPTDPNHDGKYEDLDGNGWIGFNDVLLLYKYMDAIGTGTYGPVSYFDFDGSGFIGFNDVVWLYNMT